MKKQLSNITLIIALYIGLTIPTLAYNADRVDTSNIGAVLSSQKLIVDGKNIDCEKYNINGNNYFKLRDIAQLLNGTGSQFGVGYDADTSTVTITTGSVYVSTGEELKADTDKSSTAKVSSQIIKIDGTKYNELTVYNLGNNNFFQLRELGNLLGFEVNYNQSTNTAIINSKQSNSNTTPQQQEDKSNGYYTTEDIERYIQEHSDIITQEGAERLRALKEADPGFWIDKDGMYHSKFANHAENVHIS